MQPTMCPPYDIGNLKDCPERLYDLCIQFHAMWQPGDSSGNDCELTRVLDRVYQTLWGSLPPVLTIDFRDADDPATWGGFGDPAVKGDMLPKLYTMQDIAQIFAVSKSTVSRWLKSGVLPSVSIGGRRYVERQAVEAVIQAQKPQEETNCGIDIPQ